VFEPLVGFLGGSLQLFFKIEKIFLKPVAGLVRGLCVGHALSHGCSYKHGGGRAPPYENQTLSKKIIGVGVGIGRLEPINTME
jgi:hypothetical protein